MLQNSRIWRMDTDCNHFLVSTHIFPFVDPGDRSLTLAMLHWVVSIFSVVHDYSQLWFADIMDINVLFR